MAQDISNLAINASFQNLVQVSSSAEGNMLATATGTDFTVATASYALNSANQESASYASSASQAEFAATANEADFATQAGIATLATTASYALTAGTADVALTTNTASVAIQAVSSSYALVAASVEGSIASASFAENARTADSATSASHAESASLATLAEGNVVSATNDFSEITFTKGDGTTFDIDVTPRQVIETVKNMDVTTLVKGTPVYISGSTGNAVNVYKADAADASKMPASFILEQTLDPTEEGTGILSGFINGVSTVGFEDGDSVWVAAGGGYTNVKPTGANIIQRLGNVIKGQSVNGSGLISPNEETDVPNITSGYAWVGNENQVATAVSTASFSVANAVSADTAATASHALDIKQGIDVSFNSGSFNDITATTLSVTNFNAVTSSVVITGDAFIQLNNDTPAQQYAGINVVDSGSNTTASFFFDGNTNDWNYEYNDGAVDYGVAMFGPEYSVKGTPVYNTANTLVKADGGHHLLDSSITDDGTLVNVSANLTANVITANTNFAGNLEGNADTATSASYAIFSPTSVSSSFAENSRNATSASFAENASVADSSPNLVSDVVGGFASNQIDITKDGFTSTVTINGVANATSASFASTISDTLTQNITVNGATNGQVVTVAPSNSTSSIDLSQGNFFLCYLVGSANTHITATNVQAGQNINLKLLQTGGSGTITFDTTKFKFADGIPFESSAGAAQTYDLVSAVSFDANSLVATGIKNLS